MLACSFSNADCIAWRRETMLLRGVAHTPYDMRGFEWLPILGGVFFLILGIFGKSRGTEKKTVGGLISLIFVCGSMIALGIWSLFRK
jgi:hypothetical protein